jgi:hypothetical protein
MPQLRLAQFKQGRTELRKSYQRKKEDDICDDALLPRVLYEIVRFTSPGLSHLSRSVRNTASSTQRNTSFSPIKEYASSQWNINECIRMHSAGRKKQHVRRRYEEMGS